MNSNNRKSPGARGIPQPFNRQAGRAPQFKPVVAQLKTRVSAQSVKRPVAPPVYRPQATPAAAQTKMAHGVLNRKSPVATPVYRLQQVPKVLQTKSSSAQNSKAGQAPRQPVAPPVYRPQAKQVNAQPGLLAQMKSKAVAPNTVHSQQLRGHELTHIAQQRAGRARNSFGSSTAVVQPRAMKTEARLSQRSVQPISGPTKPVQPARRPMANRSPFSNTVQAMFVDPMPHMDHQWKPGLGVFFDPNCGWYCQIAAIKHWVSKLHLTCPEDVLPKTSLLGYSPGNEGASLAAAFVKPTTVAGWENLLSQKGPIVVAGKLGGADWGVLGGIGHFVLIVGADSTNSTLSYLDPLQGNSVRTNDFQHAQDRITSHAYGIKVDELRRLCSKYEEAKRNKWLDDVKEKWETRTSNAVNVSQEGSSYITNDML